MAAIPKASGDDPLILIQAVSPVIEDARNQTLSLSIDPVKYVYSYGDMITVGYVGEPGLKENDFGGY